MRNVSVVAVAAFDVIPDGTATVGDVDDVVVALFVAMDGRSSAGVAKTRQHRAAQTTSTPTTNEVPIGGAHQRVIYM
jgi:hypothetical protein